MRFSKYLASALILALIFISCKEEPKTKTIEEPVVEVAVPDFNPDSAYYFVQKQVDMGPRVPGTKAHKEFIDWAIQELASKGANVIAQKFEADTPYQKNVKGTNVIAQFNKEYKKRLVLAAHFDSRYMSDQEEEESLKSKPVDGADDGASGVGVLLEIARILQNNNIKMGIDIVLFDLEDQGDSGGAIETWGIGAQYWSRHLHRPAYRPKFGILLDMVGAKDALFAKEAYSLKYAGDYVHKIWRMAQNMGYSDKFINARSAAIDDHYFVNTIAGIPMLDIINKKPGDTGEFGEHWHTQDDNINVIDKRTLDIVGTVVTHVIYKEAAGQF